MEDVCEMFLDCNFGASSICLCGVCSFSRIAKEQRSSGRKPRPVTGNKERKGEGREEEKSREKEEKKEGRKRKRKGREEEEEGGRGRGQGRERGPHSLAQL